MRRAIIEADSVRSCEPAFSVVKSPQEYPPLLGDPTAPSSFFGMAVLASSAVLVDKAARLRAAFAVRSIDEAVLETAVCEYADEAKRLGWPVERVIIEIKRFSEIEEGPLHRPEPYDRIQGQRIVERVVTWCVEHYYRAVPRSRRSSF